MLTHARWRVVFRVRSQNQQMNPTTKQKINQKNYRYRDEEKQFLNVSDVTLNE